MLTRGEKINQIERIEELLISYELDDQELSGQDYIIEIINILIDRIKDLERRLDV